MQDPAAAQAPQAPLAPSARKLQLESLQRALALARQRRLPATAARELPRLYRFALSELAREESGLARSSEVEALRRLTAEAHGLLGPLQARPAEPLPLRCWRFLTRESPRALRQEGGLVLGALLLFYLLVGAAWLAVERDLALAWTLCDPAMVEAEIAQLQDTGPDEMFRGNFTFGQAESPGTAGLIIGNNVKVAVLFFGAGLIPPLMVYVFGINALMVGTYTAVAGHWGRATEISSILWCHGVLELQAFLLATAAGLVLTRAACWPRGLSRALALQQAGAQAWRLFAPVPVMLLIAGLIEGFVSPHAPTPVRLAVALSSGCLLLAWALLGGRRSPAPAAQKPA